MRRIHVLVLTIALAACAPSTTAPVAGVSPSPSTAGGSLAGALGGDAQLEGGCVWLDTGTERLEIVWPAGYRADVNPIELRDPTGAVIATEGDRLTVEGRPATGQMSSCQVGALWEATAVSADG